MKILMKGKVETVSLDRVKPAHSDSKPEAGTEKQRKTQKNTKISKNTAIVFRYQLSIKIPTRRDLNQLHEPTTRAVIIIICEYKFARPGIIKIIM